MSSFVVPEAGWYILDKDGWRKAENGEMHLVLLADEEAQTVTFDTDPLKVPWTDR